MTRWRTARDAGLNLSADEHAELESLIDAELQASGQRAAAAAQRLGK